MGARNCKRVETYILGEQPISAFEVCKYICRYVWVGVPRGVPETTPEVGTAQPLLMRGPGRAGGGFPSTIGYCPVPWSEGARLNSRPAGALVLGLIRPKGLPGSQTGYGLSAQAV